MVTVAQKTLVQDTFAIITPIADDAAVFTSRSAIAPDAKPAAMKRSGALAASARTMPTFTHHNSRPVDADRAVTSPDRVAAQIFPVDPTLLQGHFEAPIAMVVRNLDDMGALREPLRDLGAQHVHWGARRLRPLSCRCSRVRRCTQRCLRSSSPRAMIPWSMCNSARLRIRNGAFD